ncbi:E3 ubiquitin-protein ligase SDIR1 [Smittium mucronatum]|uniref:RING-type E3 ubiquitin transferase n=1 Tax=Smittium mucronatum TaxID=133383 RepID=A0A1R0GY87_9FUNG|nr:E3 ubiquitin-protein ligase SDIR1 [Smittium mucronatum]
MSSVFPPYTSGQFVGFFSQSRNTAIISYYLPREPSAYYSYGVVASPYNTSSTRTSTLLTVFLVWLSRKGRVRANNRTDFMYYQRNNGPPSTQRANGNSSNPIPSTLQKGLSKAELENYLVVKFTSSMIRSTTNFSKTNNEKTLSRGSQEMKNSQGILKFASRVLTDPLSIAERGLVSCDNEKENEFKAAKNYDEDCLICFEKINIGEDIRIIPCLHKFHKGCLDQWLLGRSGSCPNCRMDLHIHPNADVS